MMAISSGLLDTRDIHGLVFVFMFMRAIHDRLDGDKELNGMVVFFLGGWAAFVFDCVFFGDWGAAFFAGWSIAFWRVISWIGAVGHPVFFIGFKYGPGLAFGVIYCLISAHILSPFIMVSVGSADGLAYFGPRHHCFLLFYVLFCYALFLIVQVFHPNASCAHLP